MQASNLAPNTGVIDANNEKLKFLHAHHAAGFAAGRGKGCPFLALQTGVSISDDTHTLKAGVRGPTLMEDQAFREKLQHFDHERIPERVVHARGTGAHGYFQCYKNCADVTKAAVFSDPAVKTPLFIRFSTVLGSKGSMDTARDVRGVAIKFYTTEGNWDLVGNNIPVFFIQDAVKFPDLVHAAKPEPQMEIPQAQTAHDNAWDFFSWTPESTHMLMWAMSDRAIPRSYRMMQGFGVHTFSLINKEEKRTFVKFHIRPKLGVHGLAWDEAVKLGGADPDFHRRDLYEAITSGNFPEYELGFQLVSEDKENSFDFDLLDCTKIIPEELVPIEWIGKIVLDRVPADFFAEVEQVAFCTQNVVPGIDFTNDPMLQGRNFSYLDTQLSRLGTVNFNQIPINQPLNAVVNNQRDGHMQMKIPTDKLNYYPNRLSAQGKTAMPTDGGESQSSDATAAQRSAALRSFKESMEGVKERVKAPKFLEFYDQASLFYNSQSEIEKNHILSAASFELSQVEDLGVRQRMVNAFNEVDHELGKKLAKNIGVSEPGAPKHKNHMQKSKFLSMIESPYSKFDSIATRKVACIVGDGYRASELSALRSAMKAEGATLVIIGTHKGAITSDNVPSVVSSNVSEERKEQVSAHDPTSNCVHADKTLFNCKSVVFDAVVLIGGSHIEQLKQQGCVQGFIAEALKHGKAVGALTESVQLLEALCKLANIKLSTAKDQGTVSDQGVVSSQTSDADFMSQFTNASKQHRCWTRQDQMLPV